MTVGIVVTTRVSLWVPVVETVSAVLFFVVMVVSSSISFQFLNTQIV